MEHLRRIYRGQRGAGFIDVIVGTALMLIVFAGIAGIIQLSVRLVGNAKARVGAVALANEQMEFLRSLPFSSVAVEGGIPAGNVTSTETISINNIDYTRRTLVQYVDDPADGTLASSTDTIFTDYKVAKVAVSWNLRGETKTVSLVSNIVPRGLETGGDGGIISAAVLSATGVPVEGASVHFFNDGVMPPVDTTVLTNSVGEALAVGAATGTGYMVTVTKDGHSTAQTYDVTAQNPEPSPGHLTVQDATITFATFQIDALAQKTVRTFDFERSATWTDPFDSDMMIASAVNTEVVSGEVRLTDQGGTYPPSGTVSSIGTTAPLLKSWTNVSWNDVTSASTTVTYRVEYDMGGGVYGLVPDAVLSGNAAGFTASPVDLSNVSTTTYSMLRLSATLTTTDPNQTPSVHDWSLSFVEGPIPLPHVSFAMRGDKIIGTTGPVYKYDESLQTGADGTVLIPDLEWDVYALAPTATGKHVYEICEPQPRSVNPGNVITTNVFFTTETSNSLRIVATDAVTQSVLSGASVRVVGSGYDETRPASSCGQSFFGALVGGTYTVEVTDSGYATASTTTTVSGETLETISLNPA